MFDYQRVHGWARSFPDHAGSLHPAFRVWANRKRKMPIRTAWCWISFIKCHDITVLSYSIGKYVSIILLVLVVSSQPQQFSLVCIALDFTAAWKQSDAQEARRKSASFGHTGPGHTSCTWYSGQKTRDTSGSNDCCRLTLAILIWSRGNDLARLWALNGIILVRHCMTLHWY